MKSFNNIKLIVSDFDGIFTDGKLTVYSDGKTSKVIDYKDIMAVAVILKKGIKFAVLSGETSMAIDILKKNFPSIDVFQNERKKINVLLSLMEKYNVKKEDVIYIGDDINDIECLQFVANPVTVPNAHISVKSIENISITETCGGNGAVREVADLLI
ncbi:MAG: KdsC family phosphatase [Candidatus Avigastranaerophilus sp.]